MPKKTITIGAIFTLIGAIIFLFWVTSFTAKVASDPTNISNVEEVAVKMVEEATPPQANIIIVLAPYGLIGAIIIILVLIFWKKIMSTKVTIPNFG